MGNLKEENLITLQTPLKYGQRVIRIGNSIIPVGVGGINAPGTGSDSSSVAAADITLGVVDQNGFFQPLRFEGTQASNSGSAIEVLQYKSWNSTLPAPQPSGGSMEFYKCASVDASNSTWTGYRAVQDPVTKIYSFESDSISGFIYSRIKPTTGKIYTDDALIEAKLYTGIPTQGLVFYAPLQSGAATQTGQILTADNISFTVQDGISCAYFNGQDGCIYDTSSDTGTVGLSTFTISLWLKGITSNTNAAFLSLGSWSAYTNCQLILKPNGRLHQYTDTGVADGKAQLDFASGNDGKWHSLIYINDGRSASTYFDGQLANQVVRSDPVQLSTGLCLGQNFTSQGEVGRDDYFYGWLTTCRTYNRVISFDEIAALAAEFTPTQS